MSGTILNLKKNKMTLVFHFPSIWYYSADTVFYCILIPYPYKAAIHIKNMFKPLTMTMKVLFVFMITAGKPQLTTCYQLFYLVS